MALQTWHPVISRKARGRRERTRKESLGEYEEIYVPVRMEDGGDVSHVPGRENESGQSRWYSTGLPVEKGSVIPYNSVFSDYKKMLSTGLSKPGFLRDEGYRREYFSSLE